jgi:putative Holliday junction resolvase
MSVLPNTDSVLALDVGNKRIGIAIASLIARLPRPLTTLANDENFIEQLQTIINNERAGALVIGLPRGLDGQETGQTKIVRQFVAELTPLMTIPIHLQDEALTSAKAEAELRARGKLYEKGEVDSLAATYILEDYMNTHGADLHG